jgi:DNA invertase Pin-like site-specific DNA recombinase
MMVGYARTSTTEQVAGFDAQRRDLEAAGCTRVFAEQVSSVARREQLEAALDYLREGDVLCVTKLDRLARSVRHLCELVAVIERKGASLRILGMNLDTTTATGRLMLNVLGSVAEFERAMMLERQREGVAKAKAEGKYKGRAPTARAKADEVERLLASGVSPTEVADTLGISRSSVYRIVESRGLVREPTRYCDSNSATLPEQPAAEGAKAG